MLPATFARIQTLVRDRSAIVLEPGKEYLVEARLSPIARAHGLAHIDAPCLRAERGHRHL